MTPQQGTVPFPDGLLSHAVDVLVGGDIHGVLLVTLVLLTAWVPGAERPAYQVAFWAALGLVAAGWIVIRFRLKRPLRME